MALNPASLSDNAAALGAGGKVGPHPAVEQVKAATTACGELVQALKKLPGVDVKAVEAAGKQVGESIMTLLKTVKKS